MLIMAMRKLGVDPEDPSNRVSRCGWDLLHILLSSRGFVLLLAFITWSQSSYGLCLGGIALASRKGGSTPSE